eukprot:scaffold12258_cov158-Skeletonema_menzelii.AAC.6
MIVRLPNNVARCITLMFCVGPVALIMAQTSSPAPFVTTPPTYATTNSPTAKPVTTDAPTTLSPVTISVAPVVATGTPTIQPVTAAPTVSV